MKSLFLVTFSLCFLQASGFFLNHTCYTIKNGVGWQKIKSCIDCFENAYPDEPEHIDKLDESAQECVKQLPKDFQPCLTTETDQKYCLETVARKHFNSMRRSFWKHYRDSFTEEEKCRLNQFTAIAVYFFTIRKHSVTDWEKVHEVTTPCHDDLKSNYNFGKRAADEDDEAVSSVEATEEENEMEEADRLRSNLALMDKYSTCMVEEIRKNDDTRVIFRNSIETDCHNVPLKIVKEFFELKAKE